MFDAGIGPYCDEDDTYEFYENIPYSVTSNDASRENLRWGHDDVEGMTIDASIIGERDFHEMAVGDDDEFIDDESNDMMRTKSSTTMMSSVIGYCCVYV